MDKIEVTQAIDWARKVASSKPPRHTDASRNAARYILATRTDATPVALAHISLEDDGPYIDLQVLNGETLQPADKPVPLYTHPPATDVAALVEENEALRLELQVLRKAQALAGMSAEDRELF